MLRQLDASSVLPTDQVLCIASPVGLGYERPEKGIYVNHLASEVSTLVDQSGRRLFSEVHFIFNTKHRIHEARSALVEQAKAAGADWLFMLDPDMNPDAEMGQEHFRPFFRQSYQVLGDIWMNGGPPDIPKRTPAVIAAPAVSGPPEYKLNVFMPQGETLRRVTPEEAAVMPPHIGSVAAIGSAVMLINMRVFDRIEPPYFDDIFADARLSEVAVTQDVYFCGKCQQAGIPIYCNWYAFASHFKVCELGRPVPEAFPYHYHRAFVPPAMTVEGLREINNEQSPRAEVPSAAQQAFEESLAAGRAGVPDASQGNGRAAQGDCQGPPRFRSAPQPAMAESGNAWGADGSVVADASGRGSGESPGRDGAGGALSRLLGARHAGPDVPVRGEGLAVQ